MIKTLDHKGPLRVVTYKDLEIWTLAGWRLVAMYQESGLSTFMEPVEDQEPSDNYGTTICRRHKPSQNGETNTYFILAQEEESAIAELSAKIELLRAEKLESDNERDRVTKLAQERGQELDRLGYQLNARAAEIDRCHASERANQQSLRKMEADIAKLRTHFGEKAINEALAD